MPTGCGTAAGRRGWRDVTRAGKLAAFILLAALVLQPFPAGKLPPGERGHSGGVFCPAPAVAALFGDFTVADEAKLGKEFDIMVRSRLPLVQDPEIILYFENMVKRLSQKMPPQPFEFKVSVIRHNAVNAFAVPGGYIFIHTGLVTAMSDESEVAGVLAHEMAHVTQRHIASRIERSQAVSLLSVLGAMAGAFLGGEAGSAAIMGSVAAGQAAMLNYSRSDESEADQVGMSYLLASGYKAEGMVNAFRVLARPQWIAGSDFPSYLSTHPAIGERITNMSARLESLKRPAGKGSKADHEEFLRVQTLVRARYSNYETALQYFREQLEEGADQAQKCRAYLGLGILYARRNQVRDAQEAFRQAGACAPDDQVVMREAGRFHYLKGNRNDAATYLSRAFNMNRNDYLTLFYYARLLEDSGQLPQALSYYQDVLRHVPEDAEVHQYYAQALGKTNQLFLANLHMAYSALYSHNQRRVGQFHQQAQKLAKSPQEEAALETFERRLGEWSAYWK